MHDVLEATDGPSLRCDAGHELDEVRKTVSRWSATNASRNAVEPTMSVNINVIVPVGGSIVRPLPI
jgi:hypothetical protein